MLEMSDPIFVGTHASSQITITVEVGAHKALDSTIDPAPTDSTLSAEV